MLDNNIMGNCFLIPKHDNLPDNSPSELEMYLQKYEIKFDNLDCEERKVNYKNNYIMELTPYGNILMMYDEENNIFLYYCNKSIPNIILETVSKKFIIQFNCKYIYHKKSDNENSKDEKENNQNESDELDEVYGKFKQKRAKRNLHLVESNINRYKYLGKFDDFKILQNCKKEVDKVKNISYEEFINQSN
jgi:hypothetical protein